MKGNFSMKSQDNSPALYVAMFYFICFVISAFFNTPV